MIFHLPIKKKINQAHTRRPGNEGPHVLAIFSFLLFCFSTSYFIFRFYINLRIKIIELD